MLCLNMFNFVPCFILLYSTFDVVQSRFVYRPNIQREIKEDKVVATWHEAKEHCERQGAILASPIDAAHFNYMRSFIEVNNHTSPYFTGYKAVIHDGYFNYISVEGIFLDELPEEVINMIEKIDPEDGDCLSMDHREIRAVPCWERLPYICYTKVTNITSNVPIEVSSSVSTATNTEVMTDVLPESSTSKVTQVIAEIANMISKVRLEVPLNEPEDMRVEAATDTSIEYFWSDPDIGIEVTTDTSIEVSSSGPEDLDVEVTTDTAILVSSSEPSEGTTEPVDDTTDEIASDLPNVSIETTEVTIEVRMNNADDEEDISSGYSYYDTGSLYKLHENPLSWTNANATCAREGGFLAVINDDAEARVLAELGDIYPHVVWIGLKKENGAWNSVHSDDLKVIFNKWSIIRANYDCGVIMSTGVLDDRDCEYPLPFICEKYIISNDAEVY